MGSQENIIIYDWLSFTTKDFDPVGVQEALGMESLPWQQIKGARGYRDRLYYNGISIHFNGRDDMGVWCEMSGQGCRTFESLTVLQGGWAELFSFILNFGCNVTRLDVAYDDHIGLLNIKQIVTDTQNQEYVSKSEYWETVLSSKGSTVQIGSPQSDFLIRIYDKAAERNCPAGTHWVRCEIQMRDDRAKKFMQLPYEIGQAFTGVLVNYLRYVDPDPCDTNRWRWPLKNYWGDLLCDASAISIYERPGMEYNLDRCENYVVNLAGNALDAYIQIVGMDGLMDALYRRQTRRNPKYDLLVSQYKDFPL